MATCSILDRLHEDSVVVFVGAHPDDETLVGPFLAFCADRCREVVVVSLTPGEAGWNLHKEDLTQTLAEVRRKEYADAAKVLGCTPVVFDYVNGASRAHPQGWAVLELKPAAVQRWRTQGDKEQTADSAYARWTAERGAPAERLRQLFQDKRATVVIALEPEKGFTLSPER